MRECIEQLVCLRQAAAKRERKQRIKVVMIASSLRGKHVRTGLCAHSGRA